MGTGVRTSDPARDAAAARVAPTAGYLDRTKPFSLPKAWSSRAFSCS